MGQRIYRDLDIRGRVFSTAGAAAAHFGITENAVRAAARKGTLHRVGLGRPGAEPMPILIRGVFYASAHDAARALNVLPSAIWQALSQNRLDTVGLGPRCPRPHRSRAITIGPVTYPSLRAADRALGFVPGYISLALRRKSKHAGGRILAAAMAASAPRVAAA